MKYFLAICIAWFGWSCHGGDGSDSGDGTNNNDENLTAAGTVAGEWTGQYQSQDPSGKLVGQDAKMNLASDKTFSLELVGQANTAVKGQWDQGIDALIISVESSGIQPPFLPKKTMTLKYAMTGNTMNLSTLNNDYVFRMVRSKAAADPSAQPTPSADNPSIGKWNCVLVGQSLSWSIKIKNQAEGFWASYSQSGSAAIAMSGTYSNQKNDYDMRIDACLDDDDLVGYHLHFVQTEDNKASLELLKPTNGTLTSVDNGPCGRAD